MMGSNPDSSDPMGVPLGGKLVVSAQPKEYQLPVIEYLYAE